MSEDVADCFNNAGCAKGCSAAQGEMCSLCLESTQSFVLRTEAIFAIAIFFIIIKMYMIKSFQNPVQLLLYVFFIPK